MAFRALAPRQQTTLASHASITGVGLHTGETATITVHPAPANHGIRFIRVDRPGNPELVANVETITERQRRTALVSPTNSEAEVHTIEHLLSAIRGLGIDNVRIDINNVELPGLDGSSADFVELLDGAGGPVTLEGPDATFTPYALTQPVGIVEGYVTIVALPPLEDEFHASYVLDYPHPRLKAFVEMTLADDKAYRTEVAPARTFVTEKEAEMLQAAGLGKGANTTNTLVMGENGPRENKLRFPDEPARHKLLDLIGDLALTGQDIRARILAVRSGHATNQALAAKLVSLLPE